MLDLYNIKPSLVRQTPSTAIALGVYYAGFYTYGFFGGESVLGNYKPTPTEETADEVRKRGLQTRQITDEAVKSAEKLLDDLWRNKPTFEIPQVKIPKFDLPELPDLEPPNFPDFKFPEISFPKPKPIKEKEPKPITRPKPPPTLLKHQFHIGEFDCYATVLIGFYHSQNQGTTIVDLHSGAGIFAYKFSGNQPPPYMYEGYTFADQPLKNEKVFSESKRNSNI